MDLEGFDQTDQVLNKVGDFSFKDTNDALNYLENEWYANASRASRWMDLLGDYAGAELFVIDGEAILQIVLDDPLLALGRDDETGFQIVHAYHILEQFLCEFTRRSANFEIVFWNANRHRTIQTSSSSFIVASRALARSLLFRHLLKTSIRVHVFKDLDDPLWKQYDVTNKPMFIMTNDGGEYEADLDQDEVLHVFSQRCFLLQVLSSGISLALLRGAIYRDLKILTFVFEPKRGTSTLLTAMNRVYRKIHNVLDNRGIRSGPILPNPPDSFSTKVETSHNLFRKLDFQSLIKEGIPPEIPYLFLTHSLLLPHLSIREMAQAKYDLPSDLKATIVAAFLPEVFFTASKIIASCDIPFHINGTIFSILVAFCASRRFEALSSLIEPKVIEEVDALWNSLQLSAPNFDTFQTRHPVPAPLINKSPASVVHETSPLLPFSNPVFDKQMALVHVPTQAEDLTEKINPSAFDLGQMFADTKHWHNQKSILPSYLGGHSPKPTDPWVRRRQLRSDQRFMVTMQAQAATLTGASGGILRQIVIPPVGSRATERVKKSYVKKETTPKLSSKEKLLDKIRKEKETRENNTASSWLKEKLGSMATLSIENQLSMMDSLSRNSRTSEPIIGMEVRLYHLHLELQAWINDPQRESPKSRDFYSVSIMRKVKGICEWRSLTSAAIKVITRVLIALGFEDYVVSLLPTPAIDDDRPLSFAFVKVVNSKTNTPNFPFMKITEHPVHWQLRLFGDYMDRSMDGAPDSRVSFVPDAWQRKVLDSIDRNHSLLVVAPTSAGKTFISYYAMEKVLRESDDGILVYIAPTKALVTQIAAEVYARFNKQLSGRSCWAIHTRDYRIHDPQKCQILITVPDVLAIMLLSPPLARVWTPRIKRIILDEIHSIGQQEGGAVWEQIILFAPCPIIGLSATVGSPEAFNEWLSQVQKAHGFEHTFIEHRHRYSHLRKFYYLVTGKGSFKGLRQHEDTNRSRFVHPISLLAFGMRELPHDLSLEAHDMLSLFQALHSSPEIQTKDLDPLTFFASQQLLCQKDVLRYESALKVVVTKLINSYDSAQTSNTLDAVVDSLLDPKLGEIGSDSLNTTPTSLAITEDIVPLLADLHVRGALPAILFNFDRSGCEILAKSILTTLIKAETSWRENSRQWADKMSKWEAWKSRAKDRQRAYEKAQKAQKAKRRGLDEDLPAIDQEWEWESSFNPNDPSPDFSFVDSSYSQSSLNEEIKRLAWANVPVWAFKALRRGVAVHHAGMNKHYRSLVESLFRRGAIRVIIATGTLALGINAPTKTSVFCGDSPFLTALMYRQCAGRAGRRGFDLLGNVVFYGLPIDRVQRLVYSKIPSLSGNFPLSSTLTLRLLNLLEGSNQSDFSVRTIQSLVSLPRISFGSDVGKEQLLHHLRFSIEYLRRMHLIDEKGRPMDLFAIAAHLYYTEPSNLALISLMRAGVLHAICDPKKGIEDAKKDFIHLMSSLFGRRFLPKATSREGKIRELTLKYPSMVILPPLPENARRVLMIHDVETLRIFTDYAHSFVKQHQERLPVDCSLPLSGTTFHGSCHGPVSKFRNYLNQRAIPVVVRSPFVSTSGHSDVFESIPELARTSRRGLELNEDVIPNTSHLTKMDDSEHVLNAYLLDFYIHGQVTTLAHANSIRRGDIWYLLQDFSLTLATVKSALEQLLINVSQDAAQVVGHNTQTEEWEGSDSGFASYDLEGKGDEEEDDEPEAQAASPEAFTRPQKITDADWRVYEVVREAGIDFDAKFREMWA